MDDELGEPVAESTPVYVGNVMVLISFSPDDTRAPLVQVRRCACVCGLLGRWQAKERAASSRTDISRLNYTQLCVGGGGNKIKKKRQERREKKKKRRRMCAKEQKNDRAINDVCVCVCVCVFCLLRFRVF